MVFPALGEENVAKRSDENEKKNLVGCLDRSNREREREKVFETFEKCLNTCKTKVLKKTLYTTFD